MFFTLDNLWYHNLCGLDSLEWAWPFFGDGNVLDASCFLKWLLPARIYSTHITSVQASIIDIPPILFYSADLNEDVPARFQRQKKDGYHFFASLIISVLVITTTRVCAASQDEAASGHTHRR